MAKKLSEKRQTRHEAFQSYPAIPIPIPRLDVHLLCPYLYLYLCLCLCLFSAIHSSVVVLSFSFSSWSWSHHRCHQHKTKININPGGVARMVASNAAAAVAVTEESASTKTAQSIRSGNSSNSNIKSNSNIHNSTNHHKIYNNDDDGDDFDVLASLFGSPAARDAFFANDFGTNVVHVSRATCGSNTNANSNANNSNNNSTTTTSTLRDLDSYLPCIDSDTGRMDMKVLFDTTNYIALRKRGSLNYLDKATTGYDEFCEYIRDSGSAVIPVAEENALMPFRGAVEDELREQLLQQTRNRNGAGVGEDNDNDNSDGVSTGNDASASEVCSVGINVYHSGPNAVALTRHFDQYDVFVLHLDGQKEWEIGVFPPPAEYDIGSHLKHPMEALEAVVEWKNVTLVEGDLLYIPKGIFHAATTAEGYDSTTHATIGLEY